MNDLLDRIEALRAAGVTDGGGGGGGGGAGVADAWRRAQQRSDERAARAAAWSALRTAAGLRPPGPASPGPACPGGLLSPGAAAGSVPSAASPRDSSARPSLPSEALTPATPAPKAKDSGWYSAAWSALRAGTNAPHQVPPRVGRAPLHFGYALFSNARSHLEGGL